MAWGVAALGLLLWSFLYFGSLPELIEHVFRGGYENPGTVLWRRAGLPVSAGGILGLGAVTVVGWAVLFALRPWNKRTSAGEVAGPCLIDEETTSPKPSRRPARILILGSLGILAAAVGILAGGLSTLGLVVQGYGGGGAELAHHALGLLLSTGNLIAWSSTLLGHRWGRALLYWLCGASLLHSAVFNGVLGGQTLSWMASTAVIVWILRSERAEVFFAGLFAPDEGK